MNANAAHLGGWRPLFKADWTRFVFLHYTLPPEALAPHTPLTLDCRDGRAFVSLVFFRFEGMHPAFLLPKGVGQFLFKPSSDCWFLNVRTYVRSAAGPGIQFLVEWMDNPISVYLGPLMYGLPYRKGQFESLPQANELGIGMRVSDAHSGEILEMSVTTDPSEAKALDPATLDAFLLEKYTAYTHHRGASRYFHIAHPHWSAAPAAVEQIDTALIRAHCPWFEHATFHSAHAAAGFRDVAMGPPGNVADLADEITRDTHLCEV